jgi:hypothetical protein
MSSPIEVCPAEVRRTAATLRTVADTLNTDRAGLARAPALALPWAPALASGSPGWATTRALEEVLVAVAAVLHRVADDVRDGADRFDRAAAGYEQADRRAMAGCRAG